MDTEKNSQKIIESFAYQAEPSKRLDFLQNRWQYTLVDTEIPLNGILLPLK